MTELELSFIGTGNAFVPEGMCWNGFIVNSRVLFEAPPSALMAIRRLGADPGGIDTVLISHHHGDHFLGLPMLLLHWRYFGRPSRATIVGPRGTYENAKKITDLVYPGVFDGDLPVDWVTIRAGQTLEVTGRRVEAFPMSHDSRLECLGFRLRTAGKTVAYTGDTAFCEPLKALGREVDVMVAECTSLAERSKIHMNLQTDIARLRDEIDPGTPILLTHLTGKIPDTGLVGVEAAIDLAAYRF